MFIVWTMLGNHESLMIVLTLTLCDLCLVHMRAQWLCWHRHCVIYAWYTWEPDDCVDTTIVWSMLGWHQHCVIYAWYSWEPDDCVDTIFSRGNRQTCCVFAECSAENQKSMLSEVNIKHESLQEVWHVGQGSVCVQVIEGIDFFPFWADKSEVYWGGQETSAAWSGGPNR
jgi:hypothetical protein